MASNQEIKTSTGFPVSKDGTQSSDNAESAIVNRVGETFVDHSDIVQFDTDENVLATSFDSPLDSMVSLSTTMRAEMEHSIKTFLARPYEFANFHFNTTDLRNAEITRFYLFSSMFTKEYYTSKLKGFFGFRARTHVRLQVNANRFQAGRLVLTYAPVSTNDTTHGFIGQSLTTRTQLPRVNLDVNTQTECSLSMPYISDQPFYQMDGSGQGYGGHFAVSVYSPLVEIGSDPVDCTLWVHFTDVELYWPSSITPQSGARKRVSVNRELVGENKPISGTLSKISSASSVLARIPLVSSFASPISWITGILSDAAKAAGYCKPQSSKKQPVTLNFTPNWANATGLDYSENTGVFEDNQVSILPGIGATDEDQMDLSYVLSIPTFWSASSWSKTVPAYGNIASFSLDPTAFVANIRTNLVAPTPLAYFSRLFGLWRGTIKFRIIIIKTEFHTGRLRFCFDPAQGAAVANANDMSYKVNEILDLRTASEWVIDVPYLQTSVYQKTINPLNAGKVSIIVLNELASPPTVPDSVEVAIEVMAGSDFEFAVPGISKFTYPAISTNNDSGAPFDDAITYCPSDVNFFTGFYAQGLVDEEHIQILRGDHSIAKIPHQEPGLHPAQYCIGERITSLKQLAMKPSFITKAYLGGRGINVDARRGQGINNLGSSAIIFDRDTPAFVDWVRYCYAFYRGGMNVKIFRKDSNPLIVSLKTGNCRTVTLAPPAGKLYSTTYTMVDCIRSNGSNVLNDTLVGQMAGGMGTNQTSGEYFIPHYHYNPLRRNPLCDTTYGPGGTLPSRFLCFSSISTDAYTDTTSTDLAYVALSGGDDFQCGFFVCCPWLGLNFNPRQGVDISLTSTSRAGCSLVRYN